MFRRYKKHAFSLQLSVLGNGPFLCPFNLTKHYKNRGFSRHRGKPKMAILGRGLERGFTICDAQKLCSAEHANSIVFSAKHSFAEIKECNLKNKKILPKIGGCLPTCKKVFFVCVFGCLVVLFFFVSIIFFVWKKTQKGYFPAILKSFFFFVSPKGPSLKSFFSSYSFFFSGFPFVFPFKTPFFSLLFVHQPFSENINIFGFFIIIFLAFSFLNVCLFLSNKLS